MIRMVTRRAQAAGRAIEESTRPEPSASPPAAPPTVAPPVAPPVAQPPVPPVAQPAAVAPAAVAPAPVVAAPRTTSLLQRVPRNAVLDLGAIAFLALCALFLHRDGLFGGPAFYELDTRLFYFPLAQWVAQQLQAETLPLWLPGIFTGYPIFADGELGLAYLPQLLLLNLLPTPQAMVWLRVVHAFLAGLFTFVYLRTLRLDPLPATGGALVFTFGSFLTAQLHHENVIRSAVWLPAVLTCAERSLFRAPRSAFVWASLGALAFAQAALGLHVQPVLMIVLALGLYSLFRAFVPTRNAASATRNAYLPLITGAVIVVGGLALAAVQWVPLGEWALVSSRRGGVTYEFASAFEVAPQSLITVLFPYFFRLPDATTWWSLWQQWEIELYVGIPTLALIVVGIVFARRRELLFFVPLAVLSLLIAMAQYAPLLNLHELLWSIPGFSFLRAPGRFTYLVVFACAGLTALGLQALAQRRLRLLVALVGGVPAVALLAALLAVLPSWRNWLLADSPRALAFVDSAYLSTRAQYPIDPQVVLSGVLSSLDFGTPKTTWSLLLLALTGLAFVAWVALGHRRALLGQGLFVGLLALDLLTFAADFHPRAPLASLAPALPAGITPGARVLLHDSLDVPALEPNQLLADGVATVQGYSSLPSQRHVEVEAATSTQPALFDLWSAPLIVEPSQPADLRVIDGVRLRAQHPIAAGFGGASTVFVVPPDVRPAAIRVIGSLGYAFAVPQGQTVATLDVGADVIPLRAGIELSERAFDRPSLRGSLQHQRAPVALDFEEATAEGEVYTAHLYEATIPLPAQSSPRSIVLTSLMPSVLVEVQGLGLVDAGGAVRSLDLADRDGFRRLGPEAIENTRALPRAFVLPRAQAFSPARHPNLTATQLVTNPDVDLHAMVLIEGDPNTPDAPGPARHLAAAATTIVDAGPTSVRVTATATEPSYLVLGDFYQRGWTARVDGQPARVVIANALFRAVAIEPGEHVVEFRYEPTSLLLGAAISAASVVVMLACIAFGLIRGRRGH
ncbi:MAG TPA: YfhO family protein [Chloroflexota bacterium]